MKPILHLAIFVLLLLLGYLLSRPVSSSLVRYLLWRATPSARPTKGSVQTQGATLHYSTFGKGPAVLLLHGGLSNRISWFSQIPWLVESGRQVVLPDVRGHGFSGLGKKELNYRLLADDAVQIMDSLGIQKADVVGWSDGGNTALLLAKDHPGRIGKMVVVSANFNPSGLTPEMREEARTQSHGPALWLKQWWTGAGEHAAQLEKRVKRMWRTFPTLQPEDLQKISVPTLVVVGRHDAVSVAHAQKMAEAIPHSQLLVVPGGHATPITHSVQLNAAMAAFLEIPAPN